MLPALLDGTDFQSIGFALIDPKLPGLFYGLAGPNPGGIGSVVPVAKPEKVALKSANKKTLTGGSLILVLCVGNIFHDHYEAHEDS